MAERFVKIEPKDYLSNPGYLKLDLMLRGVRLAPELLQSFGVASDLCTDFGYVGDLLLVLPEQIWVSVPFRPAFARKSPYEIESSGGSTVLKNGSSELPVRIIPPLGFYSKQTRGGTPMHDIGALRGRTLALAPNRSCSLLGTGSECRFCSAVLIQTTPVKSLEDVIEAVQAALDEGPLDMVYISLGLIPGADRGLEMIDPYVRAIKRNFDVLVGLDICPPADDTWIDRTYAMGFDTVSYNLEVFDPKRFTQVCSGLDRDVGRARYLDALRYAATVFPAGAVTSHLIVGLESPESTMTGIDALTDMGVVPVLPIFQPQKGIDLRDEAGGVPKAEELAPIYGYLYQRLKQKRVPLRWVKDISVVTTPLEGRFFVGEQARLQVFLEGFYKTAIGRRYMARLSDLRRALRVKEVRDSLDSSGL